MDKSEQMHAVLFEPFESNAIDNLEGSLIDIKRLSEAGLPTDKVCIHTIERVIKQLIKAKNVFDEGGL